MTDIESTSLAQVASQAQSQMNEEDADVIGTQVEDVQNLHNTEADAVHSAAAQIDNVDDATVEDATVTVEMYDQ